MPTQVTPMRSAEADAGMTASVSPVLPGVVSFRMADMNPVTGMSYARSRFSELPDYAAAVVVEHADLCADEWDGLVLFNEVEEFIDVDALFEVDLGKWSRALAASLSVGELAFAVAWSGADLPKLSPRTSKDEVFALAGLGIRRHGLKAIRAADEQARRLRTARKYAEAEKLYGVGRARQDQAHGLAYCALPSSLVLSRAALDEAEGDVVAVIA